MLNSSTGKRIVTCCLLIILFITIIIADACRKIDYNREKKVSIDYAAKFFTIPATTNPTIRRLAEAMKKYNQQNDYVSSFAKKHGFPKWDKCPKMLVGSGSNHRGNGGDYKDTVAFVPITNTWSGPGDAERVVSFLAARLTADSIQIRLFNTDDYAAYGLTDRTDTLSAEYIASFSMYLETIAVPDRDSFRLVDDRLFPSFTKNGDSSRVTFFTESTGGGEQDRIGLSIPVETTQCFTYCHNYKCFRSATDPWGPYCYDVCYNFWSFIVQDEPGIILTGGGGGGNGGGTGGLGQQANCTLYPQGVCGQPPFLAWVPIGLVEELDNNYLNLGLRHFKNWVVSPEDEQKSTEWSENNIDTTGLDSCVRKVLDKILSGNTAIGKMLGKLDRGIFKENNISNFNLRFRIDTLNNGLLGKAKDGSFDSISKVFSARIVLTPTFIASATELQIAAIIMHETIHAYLMSLYFRWYYSDFNPTQITNMPYDSIFSKYIDSLIMTNTQKGVVGWLNGNYERDHSYIADHFVELFADALKSVDDARNSDEFYWLLAWGGLQYSRTMSFYWPNVPAWDPLNPAPSNDSTWGLKYAFTKARLDSMRNYIWRETDGDPLAKGRRRTQSGCYY